VETAATAALTAFNLAAAVVERLARTESEETEHPAEPATLAAQGAAVTVAELTDRPRAATLAEMVVTTLLALVMALAAQIAILEPQEQTAVAVVVVERLLFRGQEEQEQNSILLTVLEAAEVEEPERLTLVRQVRYMAVAVVEEATGQADSVQAVRAKPESSLSPISNQVSLILYE
jgi:hypothetical protein